jgi:hypothetical protein
MNRIWINLRRQTKNHKISTMIKCHLLTMLTEEVLDVVLGFLDTPSLARWDGCSSSTSRLSQRAWQAHCERHVSAVSFARVDLNQHFPSPKEQVILAHRTRAYANRMEDVNRSHTCEEATRMLSTEFHHQALEEPTRFIFYARLASYKHFIETGITLEELDSVHWEGFVTAEDQGAGLNESTILFFHMRELASKIQWNDSMKQLLEYNHDDDGNLFSLLETAFFSLRTFALTVVAVPKQSTATSAFPTVVVATHGFASSTHDNQNFFCLGDRTYSRVIESEDDYPSQERLPTNTEVFSRLIGSVTNPNTGKLGQLLGIRLVCNGV